MTFVSLGKIIVFSIVLILILSMGLHMLITQHRHPAFMERVEAVNHAAEKIIFLLFLISSVLLSAAYALQNLLKISRQLYRTSENIAIDFINYSFVTEGISMGIVHSRVD